MSMYAEGIDQSTDLITSLNYYTRNSVFSCQATGQADDLMNAGVTKTQDHCPG